jgi:uncharacterized membrane protein
MQLNQATVDSVANKEIIDGLKVQMDLITKNLENQIRDVKGSVISVTIHLIFGVTLMFYIIISMYFKPTDRSLPSIFKIVNVFSYIIGTTVILLILPVYTYSTKFKKLIEFKLKSQYYDHLTTPCIIFGVILIYTFVLFCIGSHKALKLGKTEATVLIIFAIIGTFLSSYFFFS